VRLRLLNPSALNTRTARIFDEAMKCRRNASIILRRSTKIAEDTVFLRAPHPTSSAHGTTTRALKWPLFLFQESDWIRSESMKGYTQLRSSLMKLKRILSRKRGEY